jgi:hypothetical protein
MARALDYAQTAPASVRAAEPVLGGTVLARSLYEEAPTQNLGGPSADDIRNRKRRSFQRSLLLAAVATILIGSFSAYRLANAEPESEPIASPPTITAPSTTTTAVEAPHDEASVSPSRKHVRPPERKPVDPPVQQSPVVQTPPPVAPVAQQQAPAPQVVPPVQAMPALQPLPERPRVAVVGKGKDALLAGALELEIERRLSSRYDVSDELGDPDVQELLEKKEKGKDVSFKELGAQLLKSGFHVLVLIQVDEAESRKFELGGVAGNVKAARMRMNAYLLPANRTLGSWVEPIEYTEGSAEPKARQAFIGPTADLRAAIDNGWAQLRAGAAR